ncbi:MAG: nucleotide exchange factor GrpE [Bdellovibrionales bacterium]|nr:nucleotide exchange factor GrpE [Bdellovibrionales bacterium]
MSNGEEFSQEKNVHGASEEPAAADAPEAPEAATETVSPLEEWKQRTAYLTAEIDNMRKRFAREKGDLLRFAAEESIKAMIPVLDNLHLAMKAVKDAESKDGAESHPLLNKLLQGVDMTVKHFEQTLERMGVQPVDAVGQTFDPTKHEAIAQSESPEHKEGVVTAEMQRGYTLHGRLVRPARVVVNKAVN